MSLRRRFLVTWLLLVGACAPGRRAETALERIERSPERLIAEVARVRGLPNRRPVVIRFHDDAEFARWIGAPTQGGALLPPVAADPPWPAHLLGGAARSGREVTQTDLLREQVTAIYVPATHSIHVRRPQVSTPESERITVWALVHEIGHALQSEHFKLPDLRQIDGWDSRLAALALIEGDAMLTLLGYIAEQERIPLRRAVVQVQGSILSGDFEHAVRMSGTSRALMQAPPLTRASLLFPYAQGMTFVGAAHRAGGFALVNRLYQAVPTTTEQVLHPEKYAAGELAVEVRVPTAPTGYRTLASGSFGELGVRAILAPCLARPVAYSAAAGWGGDAYAQVTAPDGQPALLWSTVWDHASDALEFDQTLQSAAGCLLGVGAEVPVRVARAERRVVVLVGLTAAEREASAARLLSVPVVVRARRPPLPEVGLQPVPVPVRPGRVVVANGLYTDGRLGLQARIPKGFLARAKGDVLVMVRPGARASTASIMLSDRIVTAAAREQLFRDFVVGLAGSFSVEVTPEVLSTRVVPTVLGVGVARDWSLPEVGAQVRLTIVPICGDTGAAAFALLWHGEAARHTLENWFSRLRRSAAQPPVCAFLNP